MFVNIQPKILLPVLNSGLVLGPSYAESMLLPALARKVTEPTLVPALGSNCYIQNLAFSQHLERQLALT